MNLVEKLSNNKLLTNILAIEIALRDAHKNKSKEDLIEVIKAAYSKEDLLNVLSYYYCPEYFGIALMSCDNSLGCKSCWRMIISIYERNITNEKS